MRFSYFTCALTFTITAILYGPFTANAVPVPRGSRLYVTRQVHIGNGIVAPSNGMIVTEGSSFPFEYEDSNWCEDGYSVISVWFTGYAPTTSSLNSTGQFPEGEYSYYFGSYLIPNFGIPTLPPGYSLPPSNLTLPDSVPVSAGGEGYLSVVETATGCPGGVSEPPQYELSYVSLIVV